MALPKQKRALAWKKYTTAVVEVVTNISYGRHDTPNYHAPPSWHSQLRKEPDTSFFFLKNSTWAGQVWRGWQDKEMKMKREEKDIVKVEKRGGGLQMCLMLGNAMASLWKSESKDWRKRRRAPSQPQFFLRSSPLATKIASLPIKMRKSEKSKQLAQKVIIQVVFLVEWNQSRVWNFQVKSKYPFYRTRVRSLGMLVTNSLTN